METAEAKPQSADAQAALEEELVEIFSDLADIFGNPRSLGAIYGLLFASPNSLSMEDIIARLKISKGSASQGLRQLEELGAITRSKEDGERTHTYAARLELKPLISGFVSKRLMPRLSQGADRLKRLQEILPTLPETAQPVARMRLGRIAKWHHRAKTFLPLAQRFLQAD